MAQTAAFFDLDRTLLSGASGPIISAALRDAGVISSRTIPGEGLVYGLFNRIGETLPSMALARQAANVAKGWRQSVVDEAAKQAAEAPASTACSRTPARSSTSTAPRGARWCWRRRRPTTS